MGKKRRGDQPQIESEIGRKSLQNGASSSRVSPDETPRGAISDHILEGILRILQQMQVKDDRLAQIQNQQAETEQKYQKKHKKVKDEFKEMKENFKEHKKECKVMKEELEELRKMKEEFKEHKNECKLRKEELVELKATAIVPTSGYSSPAQRTPPGHSQQPRLKLKILSEVLEKCYKGESILTKTMNCVQVQLFDGDNPIPHDHPLSSVKVKLVILKEEFNRDGDQEYWSKENFLNGLKRHGDQNTPMRIKNCTFNLDSGYASHASASILDNSNRRDVRLGVMIVGHPEERVLEGISNKFRVQEAKTDPKKKAHEDEYNLAANSQQQDPMNNQSHPTTAQSAEHGQGFVSYERQSSPLAPQMNSVQQSLFQLNGNGQLLSRDSPQNLQSNFMTVPLDYSSHTTITHMDNLTTGQVEAGYFQQSFQQNSMDTSHYTAITHSGHGENSQVPKGFGHPHNICPPSNSSTTWDMLGFQTGSTSQQDGPFAEMGGYAGDFPPQTQNQLMLNFQFGNGGSTRINRAQLLWDEPDVEPRQCWNIFDKLMPLFPDLRLVHEYDRLLASDYFLNTMIRVHGAVGIAQRGIQWHHNRGVIIQPIEDSDSEHESPLKTKRQAGYQLRFVNKACREYYIWEQIKAEDGGLLKVALYNEDSLRITSDPLSSALVEIVLLHGDFNADGQEYWTPEEFGNDILCPLSEEEPPALGGDCVLTLVHGEASLSSANFQKTSYFARTGKFKMGVKMKTTLEERVQEGITLPFLVQSHQDEGSNYTCRPSDSAGDLTKLSEEACTSQDRVSFLRRGSSFFKAEDKFTRLNPGDEENIYTTSDAELSTSGLQASGAASGPLVAGYQQREVTANRFSVKVAEYMIKVVNVAWLFLVEAPETIKGYKDYLRKQAAELEKTLLRQLVPITIMFAVTFMWVVAHAHDKFPDQISRTSVYYNAMAFTLTLCTVMLVFNKFFRKMTPELRFVLVIVFTYISVAELQLIIVMQIFFIWCLSWMLLLLRYAETKFKGKKETQALTENNAATRIHA